MKNHFFFLESVENMSFFGFVLFLNLTCHINIVLLLIKITEKVECRGLK